MDSSQTSRVKPTVTHVLLVLLPLLMLQLFINVPLSPPPFTLLPLHVLLAIGIAIAWRKGFPTWSYTWIGIWYFFLYRECLQIVFVYAPSLEYIFYWGINPLGLAILLTYISRKDWLHACVTAYPYTSVIQALYTWDSNPVLWTFISFIIYVGYYLPVIFDRSRTFTFLSLLSGTIVLGIGFHAYNFSGISSFLRYAIILLSIICYPWILYRLQFSFRS